MLVDIPRVRRILKSNKFWKYCLYFLLKMNILKVLSPSTVKKHIQICLPTLSKLIWPQNDFLSYNYCCQNVEYTYSSIWVENTNLDQKKVENRLQFTTKNRARRRNQWPWSFAVTWQYSMAIWFLKRYNSEALSDSTQRWLSLTWHF